ncbi:MAG: DUF1820 family protein [Bdellovibrionota bacterium]
MATSKDPNSYYVIHYRDPQSGENIDLKARQIGDSTLGLSFVSVSDFVFDSSTLVIKPSEDQLRKRLENVKSLHLSIYTILSIEEVGVTKLKFKNDRSNLVSFPGPEPLK